MSRVFKLLQIAEIVSLCQYASRHEGDLVAKCYYSKHKIVWEILEGGLKHKIEFQWSDIIDLKANYPDDQIGILNIVVKYINHSFNIVALAHILKLYGIC